MANIQLRHYQLLSLVSGFCITFVFGSVYTLGTITPYITSLIYYKSDPSISIVTITLLFPVYIIFQCLGMFVSTQFLRKTIGFRKLAFTAIYGMIAAVLITSLCSTFATYLLFYGVLYGFFSGIGYMLPLINCYAYLPNKKGLCAGVCMMAFGIGSLVFNQFFVHLINPNDQDPNLQHIFPQDIAANLPSAFRTITIIYFIFGTIGCCLMIPKSTLTLQEQQPPLKHRDSVDEQIVKKYISQTNGSQKQTKEPTMTMKIEQGKNVQIKQESFKQIPLRQVLKTSEYKQLMLMITTSLPFSLFVAFNYKQYGQTLSENDQLLTLLGSLGSLSNSVSRIFWCTMLDRYSFRSLILVMNGFQIIFMLLLIITQNQAIYALLIVGIYFCYGGVFGMYPTQTVRIYGDQGERIYSVVFLAFWLAGLVQFLAHFLIVKNIGDDGFIICFVVFGVLMIIAQVLVYQSNFKPRQKYARPSQIELTNKQCV